MGFPMTPSVGTIIYQGRVLTGRPLWCRVDLHRSAVTKAESVEGPLLEKREKGGTPGVLFHI